MKIHEYQAVNLFKEYGLPVPEGKLAESEEEAVKLSEGFTPCVLKAQVHSGGRGKAGGVKAARNTEEVRDAAEKLFGMRLVTRQTGPEGKIVRKVLLSETVDVVREFYVSITTDNESGNPVLMMSSDGGTEIEETAKLHPEKILRIPVSVTEGYKNYQGILAADFLGLEGENRKELQSVLKGLVRLYGEKDCSLAEINPLVIDGNGKLMCLDAKINFDDNALFRHPDVMELRDVLEEDPKEARAKEFDLNYVSLDGNIGCLVNGAGLAMATMDIIRKFGAKPANFLDVGGSATTERVTRAFELLLSDSRVEAIMVNIFGGIMKCDVIAEGIVAAAKTTGLSIPLVVRLEGTNVELGKKILDESGLAIIPASDMADAARKAVAAASEGGAK